MSVMRMCETEAGSWLIGAHEADWSYQPLLTRQYVLRSEDEGASWQLLPEASHGGWFARCFGRLDEGRPIDLGAGEVLLMARSPEGHLWQARSMDDGRTWSYPAPTPLVHPDAPPMLFKLSDGATLAAFHHNRHRDLDYTGLSSSKPELMADRSELWVALSSDGGRSWSAPRFLLANALKPAFDTPFRNHQCSYISGTVLTSCPASSILSRRRRHSSSSTRIGCTEVLRLFQHRYRLVACDAWEVVQKLCQRTTRLQIVE